MILKGSQRGGGRDLAGHLLRVDENEHVRVHELRGFTADDLKGAFKEAEAMSRGTKCRQYLFSLSLSPPEQEAVPVAIFEDAIDRIEDRLGLSGQPRAIVFHEKEGRRHAHCVWSRIDAETMTARPLPFFKNRLMEVSRDLYLEHGWQMPRGMADKAARDPTSFTLAEWQQAKRNGIDPRWMKAVAQDCWKRSDNAASLARALEEKGLFLARGDRRGVVLVDHDGSVHALARALGVKTKDVRERLGDGANLKGVSDTLKHLGERMTPALRRHVGESRQRFAKRTKALGQHQLALTQKHRAARAALDRKLEAEARAAQRECAARLPTGLRGLWHRITGRYQEVRARNEAETDAMRGSQEAARMALINAQLSERRALQAQVIELRQAQARQLLQLRAEIGRYLRFAKGFEAETDRSREPDLGRGLELERNL